MNDRTIFVFSESNKQVLQYCIKFGYSYLVTSEVKNLINLLEKFIYSHDKIIIIQDHVKWISEQEVNIHLDDKAFAICKWDLGVICLDLRHKDTKTFIKLFRLHKEFWKTWSLIKSKRYKEEKRAKKIYSKPLTKYDFKNYNALDNWNLFNFNGSNTKVETFRKTTFIYNHTFAPQEINIGIATIVLPRIELPWLNEWINHHKRLGVTKFLIYNNGFISNDTQYENEFDQFEKQYKWSKKPNIYYITDKDNEETTRELYNIANAHPEVEIVEWVQGVNHDYPYPESQMQMVYDSCKDIKYKWLYIDPDEFLHLHKHNNIQGYLTESGLINSSSIRIPSKLFSERKIGKSVSSITNWSMDEKMRKCLIDGEVSRNSTIHNLKVGDSHNYADRDDIEIYHYCGSPLDHKDQSRKKIYMDEGSPPFDKIIYSKRINRYENTGLSAIILRRIEVPWLKEWIDHHMDLGFEKIRIYDNGTLSFDDSEWAEGGRELTEEEKAKKRWKKKPDIEYFDDLSDDKILEMLKQIEADYPNVEVIPWEKGKDHEYNYPLSQWESLKDSTIKEPSTFWFFADPDEYLVLKKHNDIRELIDEYPNAKVIKFKQRIFDQRIRGKAVKDIINWGYESHMPKNLVLGKMQDGLNVHEANPIDSSDIIWIDKEVARYNHYRGVPQYMGEDQNKKDWELAGSPKKFILRDNSINDLGKK